MSTNDGPAEGPDLSRGVPIASVRDDAPLVGHVDGTPAMLVRSAGRLHAVGATCPHYGAPLAEGLVVDGQVRCPWHHAAFTLETGAVVHPPALAPLPCWEVEIRDGVARVNGKKRPVRSGGRRRGAGAPPESVVVIGGGAAGFTAVQTLRGEGFQGRITLVSSERTAPVDRPNLSKDYLAGSAPEEWIPLRPDDWYGEQDIRLLTGHAAASIDPGRRQVLLSDGTALEYDALLLATGADPVRLPLGDAPVHYLRTLHDCRAIIADAGLARRAVVIGASFIGLEVAASLRTRGLEVTVVAPEALPLERVLGRELALVVQEVHASRGVQFRLGHTVAQASAAGVQLDDGALIAADLIVAGVGVRPNVQLAESAGLTVSRGVVVDDQLRTSAPGVYAAGDIARYPAAGHADGVRVEHWVVAERQGQVAARNILGAGERYDAVPFFWSAHHEMVISYVGHAEKVDHVEIDGDPAAHDCTVRYLEQGRVRAVATIGRDRESLEAELRFEAEAARSSATAHPVGAA